MKHPLIRILPGILAVLWLSSCGSDASRSGTLSYDETKTMVIDILNSKDGQKAINQAQPKGPSILAADGAQALESDHGEQIKLAVKDALADPNYSKHLEKMMTDPKFAGDFAKALNKDLKKLHKDLLKDPEYQNRMVDMMKGKEFQQALLEATKTTEFRKQSMVIFQESLESPLFRAELLKLMQKAIEEESKPKKKGEEGQESEEGGGGGK